MFTEESALNTIYGIMIVIVLLVILFIMNILVEKYPIIVGIILIIFTGWFIGKAFELNKIVN